jgi:hypothetical protein
MEFHHKELISPRLFLNLMPADAKLMPWQPLARDEQTWALP